jgi:transglutaminase-like putative cysteine protease
MKPLILLMLILPAAFAAGFGYSRVSIDRTWKITGTGPFEFTGALAVNNSNQKIISFGTSPDMDVFSDDNGTVWVRYSGEGSANLSASAIVAIDYDTNITADPPVPGMPLPATRLTEADKAMELQAQSLGQENSSLRTIRNLVDWVHSYVTYDLSYWGKVKSASEVFSEKRGVCVEYTHLLISLARSIGFQTRYVSGYAYAGAWQPHAWAEIYVPGYGWLPADATFGQVGILDNTHLALQKGADQSSAFDTLLSKDPDASIAASDSIGTVLESEDPKGVSLSVSLDQQTYLADVAITNGRPEYVFGSYELLVPDGYGGEQSSILLLRPLETMHMYQGMNRSLFQGSFIYSVPVSASFNDAHDEKVLSVNGLLPGSGGEAAPAPSCLPAVALAAVLLLALPKSVY